MLNLKSLIASANKPVAPKTRKSTPDFNLVIDGNKTEVTLSEAFMLKADIQNNTLCIHYEPADNKTYIIVHQSEDLYKDFMKGRKLPLKDELGNEVLDAQGKKVMSDEIGKKSNKFKDTITGSGKTVAEMICQQYPETKTLTNIKGNLKEVSLDLIEDAKELGVTSIWSFELLLEVNVENLTFSNDTELTEGERVARNIEMGTKAFVTNTNMPITITSTTVTNTVQELFQ